MHRLWTCPTYREARSDLPPTHQHLGATATGDKLMWEKGLMHDPVRDAPLDARTMVLRMCGYTRTFATAVLEGNCLLMARS